MESLLKKKIHLRYFYVSASAFMSFTHEDICYGSEEEQARTAATDAAEIYIIHRVLQNG